jgi:hypothetical protein
MKLATLLALLLCTSARATDFESLSEEFVFQSVHAIDWNQTQQIAEQSARYHENGNAFDAGWVIGEHPSIAHVNAYFIGEATLHAAVTLAAVKLNAPRWVLRTWQAVTIAVDANMVARNASLGLRVRW